MAASLAHQLNCPRAGILFSVQRECQHFQLTYGIKTKLNFEIHKSCMIQNFHSTISAWLIVLFQLRYLVFCDWLDGHEMILGVNTDKSESKDSTSMNL